MKTLLTILLVLSTFFAPLFAAENSYTSFLDHTVFTPYGGSYDADKTRNKSNVFIGGVKIAKFYPSEWAIEADLAMIPKLTRQAGKQFSLSILKPLASFGIVIPYFQTGLGADLMEDSGDFFVRYGLGFIVEVTNGVFVRTEVSKRYLVSAKVSESAIIAGVTMPLFGHPKPKPAPKPIPKPKPIKKPAPVPKPTPIALEILDYDKDGIADDIDTCPNTPLGASVDQYGCLISLTLKLNFASGSAYIASKYAPELEKYAEFIKTLPGKKFEIQGHSDNRGSAKFNRTLSLRRANSVKTYLTTKLDIPRNQLTAKGFGSSQPKFDNSTASGRDKNRRIEIKLIK